MRTLWITGLLTLVAPGPIAAQDVYRVGEHVTAPQALAVTKPFYTPEAMLARIQRANHDFVELELDVLPDGTVGTIALIASSASILEADASQLARTWKFTPGTKDGTPVTVRTMVRLEYSASTSTKDGKPVTVWTVVRVEYKPR